MSLPVVVLAGGLATRLAPLTERVPKSLVEVADRPFAVHQIELLRRHGLTDIVFLVGHLGEMISNALGDGTRWGVRLRYIFDGPRALGTGGAVRRALAQLGDPFFVLYGDSYLECDYEAIERAFIDSGRSGLMTVCRNDDRWDRSNVLFVDSRIVSYSKDHRTAGMRHIDYGLGAFRKSAFTGWSAGDAFDLAAVYEDLIARDDLAGFEVAGRFYEIGSPAGLDETREYLAARGVPAQ
jgi:N-acetyl-alpha-D-muramate 1-phosphate uridylyltransferase